MAATVTVTVCDCDGVFFYEWMNSRVWCRWSSGVGGGGVLPKVWICSLIESGGRRVGVVGNTNIYSRDIHSHSPQQQFYSWTWQNKILTIFSMIPIWNFKNKYYEYAYLHITYSYMRCTLCYVYVYNSVWFSVFSHFLSQFSYVDAEHHLSFPRRSQRRYAVLW